MTAHHTVPAAVSLISSPADSDIVTRALSGRLYDEVSPGTRSFVIDLM